MKNKTRLAVFTLLLVLVLAFSGCGKSKKSSEGEKKITPNFYVYNTEEFTVVYEEKFDEKYYDEAELETMIDEELNEFNTKYVAEGNKGIEKASFNVANKKAILKLAFYSWNDYVTYASEYISSDRNAKLFIGSYNEAVAAGYNFAGKFTTSDGKESYDVTTANDDVMVIYTNQGFKMDIDGDIVAINENVSVKDGLTVTSERRENYIIYKK